MGQVAEHSITKFQALRSRSISGKKSRSVHGVGLDPAPKVQHSSTPDGAAMTGPFRTNRNLRRKSNVPTSPVGDGDVLPAKGFCASNHHAVESSWTNIWGRGLFRFPRVWAPTSKKLRPPRHVAVACDRRFPSSVSGPHARGGSHHMTRARPHRAFGSTSAMATMIQSWNNAFLRGA
ncbi:hypothetical protein NL676_004054 [Syzygium grande]|nr:hypothetical protein NL676_004054 [Syzygium grande]